MSDNKEELKKQILDKLGLASKEEAIAKGIADLTDTEKLDFVTNVFPFEDDELALMDNIAEEFELDWLKRFVQKKLKLRCSVMGWRANQIVDIAGEKRKEEGRFGFLRRLFKWENKKEVEPFE